MDLFVLPNCFSVMFMNYSCKIMTYPDEQTYFCYWRNQNLTKINARLNS